MKTDSTRNTALQAGLVLALMLPISSLRASTFDDYQRGQHYESFYNLPPPDWLRVMSLGKTEALATALWIRAIVYSGSELQARGTNEYVYRYADALLGLDADFKSVYKWVAVNALLRPEGVTVSEADAEQAVRYLERAVARWPDDGELAWKLGATLAYEVPQFTNDPSKQHAARARAVEFLRIAADLGGGPPWLASVSSQGLEKMGKRRQAIEHLQAAFATATDPNVREMLANDIQRLQGEEAVNALAEARARFDAGHERDYPYVDVGLYAQIGPPPSSAWAEQLKNRFTPPAYELHLADDVASAP